MKKTREIELDFIVDKLTNSIENVVTGDSFATEISVVAINDLKTVTKKNKWQFDWKLEYKQPEREIYKLTIVNNQNIIQGLISLEIKEDHVYMHLVESAPFNKGRTKMYAGIPGNLVAFACKLLFQRGFEGNISFFSKTQLVQHYTDSLNAIHIGGRIMIIDTYSSIKTHKQILSKMKNKVKYLDVDMIGEQGKTLTKEEQSAISAFIKKQKEKRLKSEKKKSLA